MWNFFVKNIINTCDHDWMVNGWTSIKCKKCGKRSRNKTLVRNVFNGFYSAREERMQKWGWSDEKIYEDMKDLNNAGKMHGLRN